MITLNCIWCGNTFDVAPYRAEKAKYCSKACHGAAFFRYAAEKRRAGNRAKPKMSPEELKVAKKEWDQEDHRRHREERIAKMKRKYHHDRERIRAERKQWSLNNPDRIAAQNRKRRAKHGDKIRARRRKHYRDNPGQYIANARKREERIARATPPWADLKAIEKFYVEAARLTRQTGIKHHVDHIYPLVSPVMCGLHVQDNLQVLPAAVNLRKSNRIAAAAGQPLCCAWPSGLECFT